MSWNPCPGCGQTAGVKLRYVYVNYYDGQEKISYRVRLCAGCFDQAFGSVFELAERDGGNGVWYREPRG